MIGKIMSEWKEYKLGEVVEIIKDTYMPAGNSDHAYIGLEHIEQESLRLNSVGVSSDVKSNKFKFKANDVLFGKLRPYFRKVVKPQFDGICSTDIWVFRAKKEFDQNFLFYFLANWDFVNTANNAEGGTRMPRADWSFLKETEWDFPPLPEQKSIASILSSLDDKIDLLHRQNKTLEALAEALFRQWFVEEANTKEEICLEDYVDTINGYSYKSSELNPSDNALVTLKSFHRDGSFRLDGFKEFTGKINEHQIVKQGDLIVAHTDITQDAEVIGNPVLVIGDPKYKTLVMTMDCVKVIPKNNKMSIPFLYFLMRTREFKFHCLGCANSTTVLHLSKKAIPTFWFVKPDFEKIRLFTEETENMIQKIFNNHSQIRILTRLRDTLLPKLMSGEVRMKE